MPTEVFSPEMQSTVAGDQLQLLMTAANVAANAIVITDRDAKILWTNPAFTRLTGYSREEALGQTPRLLRSGKQDQEFYRHLWHTLLSGKTWKGEVINRRKDGSFYTEEMTISPVRGIEGQIANFIAVKEDVSGRKEAEAERQRMADRLWQQHEQMAAILNSLTEGVHVIGIDGNILFENPASAAMLGYEEGEMIGLPAHQTIHHRRADGSLYPMSECRIYASRMGNRSERVCDEVFWRKDGSSFPVEYTAAPLRDKNGAVIGTTTVFTDVSARKEAEAALGAAVHIAESGRAAAERSAAFANSVSRAANAIMVSTDLNGTITSMNPMAEEMIGWTAQDLVGKHTPAIFSDPQEVAERAAQLSAELGRKVEPGFEVFVLKTLETGGEQREWSLIKRSGERVPMLLSLSLLRDREGTVNGYLGIAVDITAQKRAEEALRESQRAAEEAVRAKSEFTANMSHEIRTPVNGIIGMTELALQADLTAEQRDYLSAVQVSAESLLTVINEVLDFSKFEAGKFAIDLMPFDLREMLGDTMKIVASQAHKKNLEITLDVAPDVPDWVLSDPARIRQCVVNLVTNGVKFTDAGEVVTHVTAEAADSTGVTLHFSVRDSGMGIHPDDQAKIFEAYTQVDGSMTRRVGGTGLGLTITAQIVDAMGGRIWVESTPGVGSTFHFTLRCVEAKPPKTATGAGPESLVGQRVLIVDDNATNRKILLGMTARWKMQATAVESAAAAQAVLLTPDGLENHFDLILLDAQMPEADGFTLAKWIREHCIQMAPTIMMLSSVREPGDVHRCRELGIQLFLTKPIKQSELLKAVLEVLSSATQKAVSPPPERVALPGWRVLLAEDNIINQKLAERLLQKLGMEVVIASDGGQALQLWSQQRFSVIFMDVQMPVMDGLEVARTIRAAEAGTGVHVPIVAMTAHVMEGDEQKCLDAGMDAYVSKPIRQADLARAISIVKRSLVAREDERDSRARSAEDVEGIHPFQVV